MGKKIIDISPPERKKEKEIKEKVPFKKEPDFTFKNSEIEIQKPKFSFNFSRKKFFWALFFVLIIIFGALSFNLSRAEVDIRPKTEILTFETNLTINKEAPTINFLDKIIPGRVFETEKTVYEEFFSSGQSLKSEKARGTITVYNNYQSSQVLVANTRFQAPLEKFQTLLEAGENPWFKTVSRVVVPAKGQAQVEVIADSPGEKYNIESSTFSIPGLAGTAQYTFIYGKTFEAMSGGALIKSSQVSQGDLDRAKKIIEEKAERESFHDLKSKIPNNFLFLAESVATKIINSSSLVKSGASLEKFNYEAKAFSSVLAFTEEDLKKFALNFISSQISNNKIVHQESLKLNYSWAAQTAGEGKIILSLKLEVKVYPVGMDEALLKNALEKKSQIEAKLFLEEQPEINEAKVKLWPFWVKQIPNKTDRIKINIILD